MKILIKHYGGDVMKVAYTQVWDNATMSATLTSTKFNIDDRSNRCYKPNIDFKLLYDINDKIVLKKTINTNT